MVNRIPRRPIRYAAVALLAIAPLACISETPDVGELDPVYAPPAEYVEIVSLARGQTFGELLYGAIDANEQAALLLAFQEHASPRRMRQGTEITLRYRPDDEWLRGVDVAVTPDETIRLDRTIVGWESNRIETPVYVDTLYASGEIETVLWNAVVDNPVLADLTFEDRNRLIDHLDRVFQWQVDFSRQIRVGDTYRFAFEREVRPDGSMRAGRLLAAEFVNSGTPYHAVYFDPNDDGRGSYFDLDGESVRRAFLLKPLAYRRISSRYTMSRFHPVLRTWRAHRGVDYAANAGTEVMATSDGVVIHRGPKGSYGNLVEIRHPNGFITRYAHLRAFARDLVVGSRVKQSDVVGYVGMTGLATAPHLHYEMMRGGNHMDPLSVDLPAGDPVPSDDRVRWRTEMTGRVALLETIPRAGPVRSFVAEVESQQEGAASQPAGGAQR
ncbi:MAG: M23 family metallopeptidase [Gemmatimonadota bacterium]|nr:M23 family metallopeptidase [Gemmatimonadota bacterium]MDH3424850.1 M23 family metallopeptidase [Gemmatimonadota bacterium]